MIKLFNSKGLMINRNIFQSLTHEQQFYHTAPPYLSDEFYKKISSTWNKAFENLQSTLQRSSNRIQATRLNFSWNYAVPLILFALCVAGAYSLYQWYASLKKAREAAPSRDVNPMDEQPLPTINHDLASESAEISAMEQEDQLSSRIRAGESENLDETGNFSTNQSPLQFPTALFEELASISQQRLNTSTQREAERLETQEANSSGDDEAESSIESEGDIDFPLCHQEVTEGALNESFAEIYFGGISSTQNTRMPLWKQEQEEKTIEYIREEMCKEFGKFPLELYQHWMLISQNNQDLTKLTNIIASLLTPKNTTTTLNGYQVKVELLNALGDFYNKQEFYHDKPEIIEFIHSLVNFSIAVPLWKYFEHVVFRFIDAKLNLTSTEPETIVNLLEQDFHQISGGRFHWLEREFNKACGSIGVNFAPNLSTNYFSVLWKERYCTEDGLTIEVPVYRFGTPTQDDLTLNSSVLPVFKLWINVLQAEGKKHCYFGHQDRDGAEGRRTDALIALSDEKEPFFMFNLPLDGELYKSKRNKAVALFKGELLTSMLNSQHGFYFPIEKIIRSLPSKTPNEILQSCLDDVWENFFILEGEGGFSDDSMMTPDQQRTFILLTYVKIEQYFSAHLRASRNSTCKDGIDRAAIVNTLSYYLGAQATARAESPEEERRIINETRVVLHHAALFTKGQAVIKSRRTDLLNAMRFLSTRPEGIRRGFIQGDIRLTEIAPITSEVCSASHDNIDNFVHSLRIESPTLELSPHLPDPFLERTDEIIDSSFSYFSSLSFQNRSGQYFQGNRESVLQAIKESFEARQFLVRISAENMIDEILGNIRRKFCVACTEERIDASGSKFQLETIIFPEGKVCVTCKGSIDLLRCSSSPDIEDKVIGKIEVELVADSTKQDMKYSHTLHLRTLD